MNNATITTNIINQRYRVIKEIGQGGFANIFEVEENGTTKIIKILKYREAEYQTAIALFKRESQVLKKLRHPGLPKVEADGYFTWQEQNGRLLHCLVMEKIEGVNLKDWLAANQKLTSPLMAVNWLTQLTEILAKIHKNGYFHRDIKP